MAQRVTIKSIARDLGISHMTVSRALSNHPSVREETRKAILTHARELGYIRSAAASAMRGNATGIIGLLLPNIVNEFYARFANALALSCEEHGIQVITHLTNDDPEQEALAIARLREVQADSVVMVPAPGHPEAATLRHLEEMRVVQFIRQRDHLAEAASLLLEDAASIAEAVGTLARKGHSRIAYIGAHTELSSGRDRLAAFRNGMDQERLAAVSDYVVTVHPSFLMGRESISRLLDLPEPPSAVICGGFEISNGALEACMRRGVTFPQDLAFVGYGDPAFYEWIQGGISTISLPVDDLAECAVSLLSGNTSEAPALLSQRSELILRGTT